MGREGTEEAKPKKHEQPHPFAEVPCRCGQHQIELIALKAFKEAAQEPEVMFEMANDRLDRRSATKAFSHRRAPCSRLSFGSSSGHQDLRAINKLSAAVTAIHDGGPGPDVGNGFGLVKDLGQGVSVVKVLFMRHGPHDDAVGFGHRHGGFGSKFVFLVLLAFGHAVDVRLMQRVNLVGILRLLSQNPAVKGEVLSLFFCNGCGQLSLQFAH